MAKRQMIKIDPNLCNGCGECLPNCPEGALQMIDGKARLISDLFCDGLGACIGHCPQGAITMEEREAHAYDERQVMENIVKQGSNVIKAHLQHLIDHKEQRYLAIALAYLLEQGIPVPIEHGHEHGHGHGCPGSRVMQIPQPDAVADEQEIAGHRPSRLRQWPVQLSLVPPFAPFLQGADLLVSADCVPFAYANFHDDLLKGKVLLVGCPKFDDMEFYAEKIAQILEYNELKSITYVRMEVPCCAGLGRLIEQAIADSGKQVPFHEVTIRVNGEKQT